MSEESVTLFGLANGLAIEGLPIILGSGLHVAGNGEVELVPGAVQVTISRVDGGDVLRRVDGKPWRDLPRQLTMPEDPLDTGLSCAVCDKPVTFEQILGTAAPHPGSCLCYPEGE